VASFLLAPLLLSGSMERMPFFLLFLPPQWMYDIVANGRSGIDVDKVGWR